MSKLPTAPPGLDPGANVIRLSQLLGASVVTPSGEPLGVIDDIIMQLPSEDTKLKRKKVVIVWDQPPPRKWAEGGQHRLSPDDPVS